MSQNCQCAQPSAFEKANQELMGKIAPAAELAAKYPVTVNESPKPQDEYEQIMGAPGFGVYFTDHMFQAEWTKDNGWTNGEVLPYGPLALNPGSAVFHYGQEIFEGLKAYRHADGSIWTFRPGFNAARLNYSARRLALPEFPEEDFVGSIAALVQQDARWVPGEQGASLYLRPFVIAWEDFLGVRAAQTARYFLIASPSGPYFKNGFNPVSIAVTREYHRAAPGGTGDAKTGGNYAASLMPALEAYQKGFEQICFLDETYTYLEELGGMNVMVVRKDGTVQTPSLTGTILEGGTRGAIIQLLKDQGTAVYETRIALDQLVRDIESGEVTEMFACGTAAAISPIGRLAGDGFDVSLEKGSVTERIYQQLCGIHYGTEADPHNWMYRLV